MEKIKEYKYIISVILGVLGFTFYWFEYRPSQARTICNEIARLYANETKDKNSGISVIDLNRLYDIKYKICLNERGIKN